MSPLTLVSRSVALTTSITVPVGRSSGKLLLIGYTRKSNIGGLGLKQTSITIVLSNTRNGVKSIVCDTEDAELIRSLKAGYIIELSVLMPVKKIVPPEL